jgi:hypothetical protein
MQAGEPGDVEKIKLTEELSTTLWDRWEVSAHDLSLQEVIAKVEEQYKGLEVRDVLRGNAPVYFHAIMSAPGKEKEKETTLNSKLADLLEVSPDGSDEPYVDLTMTCVLKDAESDQIVEGIPPVRVHFAPIQSSDSEKK